MNRKPIIDNIKIYGLEESLTASGYPMRIGELRTEYLDSDLNRGKKLGSVPGGTGHDCFLKGIVTQFDLTAPAYFMQQWQRYHHQDIISSQSKMHKLTEMSLENMCNEWVLPETISTVARLVDDYNDAESPVERKQKYQTLVSNTPQGLLLTARVTSNYLQNKTVYNQRRRHKLQEWQEYCDILEQMPHFVELTQRKKK